MRIIIGTANFEKKYGVGKKKIKNFNEIKKIINFSIKNKIKTFDLAYSYIKSKKLLNEISKKNLNLISKICFNDFKNKKKFEKIYEEISHYLKITNSKIKTILFHNIKDFKSKKNREIIFKLIKILKKDKKINKFGVSLYKPKDLKFLLRFWVPDLVQIPINPLNTEFNDSGCLNILKKKKIEIHARSIFLQGLLINKKKILPKKLRGEITNIIKWKKFCAKNNLSSLEGCINFVRNFKQIRGIVFGIDNLNHLIEIKNLLTKKKKKINFNIKVSKKSLMLDARKWV